MFGGSATRKRTTRSLSMSAPPPLHPTDKTLQAYGLGKLKESAAAAIDKHLETCPDCRRRVGELSPDSFLGRLRDAKASPEKLSLARARAERAAPSSRRSPSAGARALADTLPLELADNPDYEVIRELGRGGMGVVYLVHNRLMDRREVLKLMNRDLMKRSGVLDRFLREIQSVAKLRHEHVVTAYSAMRFGESIGFAMEYVDGLDLARLVKSRGPLPVAHACKFTYQAALGLQHAHEKGMVHRDIKPGNLMLSRQGDQPLVKVLDFGLAKATKEVPLDGALTGVGQLLGTPDYIAPEQITDAQSADIRADIYSLGCTLYFLLTGGPPFQGSSLFDILQAHHSMDAQLLNIVRPEVPGELAALVAKMMAKAPEHRFQTPREVADALKPFFGKGGVAFKSAKVELSQASPATPDRPVSEPVPTPAQSANAEGGLVVPAKEAEQGVPEALWASLIDIKETESSSVAAPVMSPRRRPPWASSPTIVAASLLVVVFLGVIMWVLTDRGRIKVIVDGRRPIVKIDGEIVRVEGLGEPITLRAGTHELAVKWGDGEFKTRTFVVRRGDNEELRVEYEPKPRPDKPQVPPVVESISRTITDRMLVIRTGDIMGNAKENGNFQVHVDRNIKATLTNDIVYINEAFGRRNVLCTAPLTGTSPGTMDFSRITKERTGTLTLLVHGYPVHPGGRIVVKSDGLIIHDVPVHFGDGWKKIEVPFRRNEILVEHHADGWNMEFLFVDYWIVDDTAAGGTDGLPTSAGQAGNPLVGTPPIPPDGASGPQEPGVKPPPVSTNSIGMKLALIPDGEFQMGSPDHDIDANPDERPQHRVRISKPFYLGVYEVTRGQFRRFVEAKGYRTEAETDSKGGFGWNEERLGFFQEEPKHSWRDPGFAQTDEHPVVIVTRNDAVEFCKWLSQTEAKSYRLPTEAEWEYACRARTTTKYSSGDDPESLAAVGNVADGTLKAKYPPWGGRTIAGRDGFVHTAPVGQFRANAFGLFDMHGNVWELCQDGYDERYYRQSPAVDPLGPSQASLWVKRGGSWCDLPAFDRSAERETTPASGQMGHVGFRVALDLFETQTASTNNTTPKPTDTAGGTGSLPTSPVKSPALTSAAKLPAQTIAEAVKPGDPFPARPFRVAANGLAGKQFIDPITFGPDPYWGGEPANPAPWITGDAFARLTSRATLVYPRLPISRYVCEFELTVHTRGRMKLLLGDLHNNCNPCFDWKPERDMIKCALTHWYHGGWGWNGSRDFAPEKRISLKLVVGDGIQKLFHENKPILSVDAWPVDCCLKILSETPDSSVIHRCSLRPLTAQDVADCGWTTPPTDLTVTLKEAAARQVKPAEAFGGSAAPQEQKDQTAARLARISEGYPDQPKPGKNFAVKTTGTPMVWIPPGEFMMGSQEPGVTERLASWRHPVRLTTGYWMAQIEVTQGEYRKVTGANPSRVTGSPYLPVDWVAWDEAAAYCRKLTERESKARRLPDGYVYRLPTEAEWEYACRAGSDEDFSVPQQFVWSRGTSEGRPHEVAESRPNKWGLYDMHGNAMEWCFDAWSKYPKGKKEVTVNPLKIGKPDKDTFVVRGGAWWGQFNACASPWRYKNHNNPNGFRGFRIVLGRAIRDAETESVEIK
jgi:formylglycine-generating enzyme required for sulfatase activity/serine/threonine protein kinase